MSITAPTSLIHTVERDNAVDFTSPLVFSHKGIFIKNPTNLKNWTAYLDPLTCLSWAMIGVFFLLTPFCLYKISIKSREEKKLSILQCFESIFVAFLQLESPIRPNKMSTRIIFLR